MIVQDAESQYAALPKVKKFGFSGSADVANGGDNAGEMDNQKESPHTNNVDGGGH